MFMNAIAMRAFTTA